MARQKTSPFEDLILLSSKLPWWACLAVALVSYLVLHAVASCPPVTINLQGQFGDAITRNLISTLAMFGQIVIPGAFCIGALVSAITSYRQKEL